MPLQKTPALKVYQYKSY